MNYVSSASVPFNYVIPPAKSVNSVTANYHVEVHNASTGKKTNYAATSVTAAVAPTVAIAPTLAVPAGVPATPGTSGNVVFSSIALPNDGPYNLTVYYASSADLNTAEFESVASGYMQKITTVGSVTV